MAMYNPKHFRAEDQEAALDFIRQYDFAVVVSHGTPHATHTPMTVHHIQGQTVLFGHFARVNPHCKLLDKNTRHTCIFAGPHTYVSPSWYTTSPAVPTWNYSAVHITGTATAIADPEELRNYLLQMIKKHDPKLDTAAHMPDKFMHGMMKGIVGFTLLVEEVEFKRKLSQNKSMEDRRGVIDALNALADQDARAIAESMKTDIAEASEELS